jgi:uncharacterized OB-fold protein
VLEQLASLNPDQETRAFWEACARRELRIQRCGGCGTYRFPPLSGCRDCGATEAEWVAVSGRGKVFSFSVVHHPALAEIREDVPYAVVVVELDDAPGARLISNVLDADHDEIEIGMPLQLAWDEPAPGVVLPRFRKA